MSANVDPVELQKFSETAYRWWDPTSEYKPLHDINPLRVGYIERLAGLEGKAILDVGCGGGILSEGMAARGATVTGIDLAEKPLKVARLHLLESGLEVDYRLVAVEDHAQERPQHYDVVACMELLEHVPDPASVVRACATLVKPCGHVIFATISRNPRAYLMAVLGAEYLLGLLPRGTHDYARFIKPSELGRMARESGLTVADVTGMSYDPLAKRYSLVPDAGVNYLLGCRA